MAEFLGLQYITPLTINSRERVFRSETLNLKTQTVTSGAQRWDLTITLEPASGIGTAADAAQLSIHRSMNGRGTSFTMEMPQHLNVARPLSVRTSSAVSAGVSEAPMETVGNAAVTVPAGRYVSFPGNPKVYVVTETTTIPATGSANLPIFPPLVANVAVRQEIDSQPDITVFYAEDGIEGVTYTEGVLTRATINVVEALT